MNEEGWQRPEGVTDEDWESAKEIARIRAAEASPENTWGTSGGGLYEEWQKASLEQLHREPAPDGDEDNWAYVLARHCVEQGFTMQQTLAFVVSNAPEAATIEDLKDLGAPIARARTDYVEDILHPRWDRNAPELRHPFDCENCKYWGVRAHQLSPGWGENSVPCETCLLDGKPTVLAKCARCKNYVERSPGGHAIRWLKEHPFAWIILALALFRGCSHFFGG